MSQADVQREFALQTVKKLRAAGFEAFWAGGCVRDDLLGIRPKDYDVATNATPEEIRTVFGRRRTLAIGAAFGVITVLGPAGAGQIEVATFRTDATYSDGRHPDKVTFTDAEHDAQRRDFTINGLFFDPVSEQVVDYVGGKSDLKNGIVRAIGDPRLRLSEDKLRMLRAIRFAATFGFEIDRATFEAIQAMASQIHAVSAERIGMEIRRMIVGPHGGTAIRLLRASNLLEHVLPEIEDLPAAEFEETLRVLGALQNSSLPLALAALLHRVDQTTLTDPTVQEFSSAPPGPTPAHGVVRRLRYTNKEAERAGWLLANLPVIAAAPQLAWPRVQRILIHDGAGELVALYEAIVGAANPSNRFCHERLAWPAEKLNPTPLVDGSDLIRHGLAPGPQFSALLEQIRDAQLRGEIASREEALALADRLRPRLDTLP